MLESVCTIKGSIKVARYNLIKQKMIKVKDLQKNKIYELFEGNKMTK